MRAIVNMLSTAGKSYGDGLTYNESTNHNGVSGALALDDADTGLATGWSFNVPSRLTNRAAANGTQTFYDPNVHIEGWNYTGSHPTPQLSFTGLDNGKTYKIIYTADQSSAGTRNADVTVDGTTLTAQGSTSATPADHQAIFLNVSPTAGAIVVDLSNPNTIGWVVAIEIVEEVTPVVSITDPDNATNGTNQQFNGIGLDTATAVTVNTGSFTKSQSITAQTATTINLDIESGANDATLGVPVTGVPVESTINAAGVTLYDLDLEVTDGANPDSLAFTLNEDAQFDVIQAMIATSNIIPGDSVFGTDLIAVQDNMQARVPKSKDGQTFTWSADGAAIGSTGNTVTLDIEYFDPTVGQWSKAEWTINAAEEPVEGIMGNKLGLGIGV